MPKKSTCSYLKRKRRRTIKTKKSLNVFLNFFAPILKPITSNINDINNSYESSYIARLLESNTKEQQTKHNYYSLISPAESQRNINYIQNDDDSLYVTSFNSIDESELEAQIANQILTPSILSHNTDDEDSIISYIYKYRPSIEEYDNEIIIKGRRLLNEMKTVAYQLHSYNLSLGNLFLFSHQSYAIMNTQMKNILIELSSHYDVPFLSQIFNISKKSILRWKRNGTVRKKGAGRKTSDPEMEVKLFKWYINNKNKISITASMIKQKAIEYSNVKTFQASKGWFDKYKKKYNIIPS